MGTLPTGEVQAYAHELLLISSLRHRWQRCCYTRFLARRDCLPTPQSREEGRIVARIGAAICVVYLIACSVFLVAFSYNQDDEYDKNLLMFVEAMVNLIFDCLAVTPIFLLVQHVLLPSIAAYVLSKPLKARVRLLVTSNSAASVLHLRTHQNSKQSLKQEIKASTVAETFIAVPAVLRANNILLASIRPPLVDANGSQQGEEPQSSRPRTKAVWVMINDPMTSLPFYFCEETGEATWTLPTAGGDPVERKDQPSSDADVEERQSVCVESIENLFASESDDVELSNTFNPMTESRTPTRNSQGVPK
jgi:hypothetical protein